MRIDGVNRGPDSLAHASECWRSSPTLPRFVNHIRPALRSAGYTGGQTVDTFGYSALWAVLLLGEPIGSVASIEWGLVESDCRAGPFQKLCDLVGGSLEHCSEGMAVMWCLLGPPGGRQRYMHATVELHGDGRLVYGVYLELIPARPLAAW